MKITIRIALAASLAVAGGAAPLVGQSANTAAAHRAALVAYRLNPRSPEIAQVRVRYRVPPPPP